METDSRKEAESIIVETPLMIAAKNGIIEMVDKFQKRFPHKMSILNEEGKNIVLIAAETRQTNLYQFLKENEDDYKILFGQVDTDGNTALHLAVKPEVRLNWQTITMMDEYKWFKVSIYLLLNFFLSVPLTKKIKLHHICMPSNFQ